MIDRRGFLELAAASSVVAATGVVATGVVAAGCQGGPGGTPSPEPPPPAAPSAAEGMVAPLRVAVVPDDVPPAFSFQPMARPR